MDKAVGPGKRIGGGNGIHVVMVWRNQFRITTKSRRKVKDPPAQCKWDLVPPADRALYDPGGVNSPPRSATAERGSPAIAVLQFCPSPPRGIKSQLGTTRIKRSSFLQIEMLQTSRTLLPVSNRRETGSDTAERLAVFEHQQIPDAFFHWRRIDCVVCEKSNPK